MTKLIKIQARKLLDYTTEELINMLTGKFILIFEDGNEIETDYREVIYDSHLWEIHRKYPNTPLLLDHHVANAFDNGVLTSGTHIKLLNKIYWLTVDQYNLKTEAEKDPLIRLLYEITNTIYNNLIGIAADHVTSIDILDFIELQTHPRVWDAMEQVEENRPSIEHAHSVVMDVISNEPGVQNNNLAKAARSGMVNKNQLIQCLGPRGFVTEVDSKILPIPVVRSFTQGMNDIYNIAAESRSAAKALYFSKTPLQDAEYFARQLQLVTMSIENVYKGEDCGTDEYLHWPYVQGEQYDENGVLKRKSDLHFLEGKYYLDEESNTLKILTTEDKHLIGKSIKLRSVLFCKHEDKHGVCEVCLGGISDSIPESSNVGHISSASTTQQTTQSVLSTKHLDASSKTEKVELPSDVSHFFRVRNNVELLLGKGFSKTTKISVDPKYMLGINDVKSVNNISHIVPSRVSSVVDLVILDYMSPDLPPITIYADMVSSKRRPMFTKEYLEYMKDTGWEVDDDGNIILSFEEWDRRKPVLVYPETEYNFSAHSQEVSNIIKSGDKIDSVDSADPLTILSLLYDLINSKLNVNIAMLEIIVYALSVPDDEGNFDLTRHYPVDRRKIKSLLSVVFGRSLATAYAFQRQPDLVVNPLSFIKGKRPDHPFDVFIDPDNVLKQYNIK